MKKFGLLVIFLITSCATPRDTAAISDIRKFQSALNEEFKNPKETPLRGRNFTNFTQHPFFPIDLKYRIAAEIRKTPDAAPFEMPTSSGKTKTYQEYGKAHFSLGGKQFTLTVYQNLALREKPGFEDYLFLPFRDETNGKETYGGGKYLDLRIPEGNTILLDFNKSYQPFCAYNAYDYSCPIVPEENFLRVRIEAGVMYEDVYH